MKPEYRTRALDVAHATEAARQKRLTAHQLSHYELDINDLREHTA